MKHSIGLLLLLIIRLSAYGQGLGERLKAEQDLVLLTNHRLVVPFERLDTLKIAVLSDFQPGVLRSAINRYTRCVEPDSANLLIVAVKNIDSFNLSLSKPAVVLVFDTAVADITGLASKAQAVLYVGAADSLHQDYAVQLLFGAIGAKGVLPRNIEPFVKGYGLVSAGGLRLKYTIPQEVGIDSARLFGVVDSIMNLGIKVQAFPGAQLLIAVDGKVILRKSYGFHTYDSIRPVRMTDLYDLASVTKIAASAPCLMWLYDKGLISLDSRLGELCGCMRHSNKDTIRLIDALTHQARLTPWIPFWKKTLKRGGKYKRRYFSSSPSQKYPYKVADSLYASRRVRKLIYRSIRRSPLLARKQYKYSDLSFYLYPQIVENLTGKSFEQCLYENFYHPLGAYRMVFNPLRYFPKNQIIPTEFDSLFRHQLVWGYVHDEGAAMLGGVSGHAGLFANADDLAKLMQMFLNYGTYGGHRFLSDTTVKRWTSYQFADRGNRRGLVFDKPLLQHPERGTPAPEASPFSFGHTGFTGTFTWADPQTGILIVFLSNRVYPTRKNRNLIRYNIRTQVHQAVYQLLEEQQ